MSDKTRIEKCGPMSFVGVALYGNPETTRFCNAWELFGAVADDAGISRIGKDVFGLQIYHPKFPEQFELTYMACLQREPEMDVPIRMFGKSLPESRYAVQKVEGGVTGIDQALIYLYKDYIPKHGLRVAMPIDFEKYCNMQDHESCADDIEMWVPVGDA
jgi:predicted transcriptional regulator YdeE